MEFKSKKESFKRIGDACSKGFLATEIELCKQHIKNDPDYIAVWLYYAEALSDLSRYEEAESIFLKIIKDIENLDSNLLDAPYCGLGNLYERKGNYHRAIEWYKKAVEIDSNEVSYLIFIGTAYFRLGDLSEAEKYLLQATKCKNGHIDEAFYNLGIVSVAQGKYQESLKYFNKAIEIDPKYYEAKHWIKDIHKTIEIVESQQLKSQRDESKIA